MSAVAAQIECTHGDILCIVLSLHRTHVNLRMQMNIPTPFSQPQNIFAWMARLSAVLLIGLLPTLANLAYAEPVPCNSAASDTDGDGWGWENDSSCVVKAESTSKPVISLAPQVADKPVCLNPESDPDGDGYGWERDTSCLVVNQPIESTGQPPATDITPNITPSMTEGATENQTPKPCTSASSDPDGDGFGWEKGSTCLVVNAIAPLPEPVDPAPAAKPAPETVPESPPVTQIRLMAMGDSITHGVARNSAKSYRYPLTAFLDTADCRYEMVGSQQANLGHRSFVSAHEGYNGHRADHFLTGLNNYAGNNEGVATAINRFRPDTVLLHLGTNDMLQGQNVAETVAEIDQVISIILDSGADVFVANVIPLFGFAAENRTRQLGDQLTSYVTQLGNNKVKLVDVRTGFTQSMMLSDNLHPNADGEAHIAQSFSKALINAGKCS